MYGKGLSSLAVSLLGPKNLILELQVLVAYNVVLGIVVLVVMNTLHSTSLGSGSHSPFPIHVAKLGPVIINPVGQLNMMLSPSSDGSLYPTTITPSLASVSGSEHLPTQYIRW